MSNARGSEPQLLSIEAIIQKSEQKSKMLNNIPIDFKKLFIEQIIKKVPLKQQPKRSTIVYEGFKNKLGPDQKWKQNKKVSSFASPSVHNSSPTKKIQRSNSMQPITTARALSESRKMKRSHRQSLAEIIPHKHFIETNDENENIMNHRNQGKNKNQLRETWQCGPFFPIGAAGLRKMQNHKNKIEISERTNTLQSQTKSEGNRAYEIKLDMKFQEQQVKCKNSDQFTISHSNFSKTQSSFPKNISPKKKTSSQKIPNFVIEAVAHEKNKIQKNCSMVKNFQFDITQDEQEKNGKIREVKAPVSLLNLKKKVDFYKARRSEESFEEVLEPKINLIKLLSKQKVSATIKNRQNQKKIRDGLGGNLKKGKKKHIQVQEEVRGWDLGHDDQF